MSLQKHIKEHAMLGITTLGVNTLTVGDGGIFTTVAEAVAFINLTNRYNTIYNTGTCTMTNGVKAITPTGGADWTGISTAANSKQLFLRLEASENIFIPLIGVTPNLTNAPTWGNYGELKYNYEGVTGAKNYSFVEPNWYHIQLLAGEIVDPVEITWPLFTTISGVSKESTLFRGSIGVNIADVGFFARNFTWGSINLVDNEGEEALITSNGTLTAEEGYMEIMLNNISCGKGNADRDCLYRKTVISSYALFSSTNCEYYSHYDAIQCTARNIIFRANDVYCQTQDTTVMLPTGFRWFSSVAAPDTDLFVDISNNNLFVGVSTGTRSAVGIILLDDTAAYLSAAPDLFGRVVNNYIQVHQLGTGNAFGLTTPNALFGTNVGRIFVDGNTFDVVSSGGTRNDMIAHATLSPLLLGQNNVIQDASVMVISGAPKRLENHGTSAAIATGVTIAHGLGAVPTYFNAVPTTAKTDVYITADATNLTVNFGGGGTSTFAWQANL